MDCPIINLQPMFLRVYPLQNPDVIGNPFLLLLYYNVFEQRLPDDIDVTLSPGSVIRIFSNFDFIEII